MVRPQRYSTLQKPISGYQPQVESDRVALINLAVRTLGNDCVQQIMVSLITTYDLSWLLTVQQLVCFSAAAPSPIQLQAKHTTRHTSNCACNLRKTDNTRNVYPSTRECVWHYQRSTQETPSQKKQKNQKISNSEY